MVRLSKVLNLSDVDWSNVRNLLCLTGRCRWAADLINFIANEIQEKRMKKEDVEHIDKETFLVDCINRVVDDITTQMANALPTSATGRSPLASSSVAPPKCGWERESRQCKQFVTAVFPTALLMKATGPRSAWKRCQLPPHRVVPYQLPMVFDKMTEGAFKITAERHNWSVTDIVATKVIDAKDNQSAHERGLNFQLVVAAALLEYEGTVADFVCKVAKRAAEADAADPPAVAGVPR